MCTILSVGKVEDFSSPFLSGGGPSGGYTDYMRAFSDDALITPHVGANAPGAGRYQSVKELEQERANLSFIPSQAVLGKKQGGSWCLTAKCNGPHR